MSVLVTGCGGFIGSGFSLLLLEKGAKVIGLDILEYPASPHTVAQLEARPNFTFVQGSICDSGLLSSLFSKYKISCVVNFAAESHVDRSFDNPAKFINTNILGTQLLLAALSAHSAKLIHISTDEVYGDSFSDMQPAHEGTQLLPTNPYSASKAAAELFVRAQTRCTGLIARIIRLSNVYGPRQYPEKIIPSFILAITRGKKCHMQGSGENRRNYLYIDDACQGIYSILRSLSDPLISHELEVYNIGSTDELKNIHVWRRLVLLSGHDPDDKQVQDNFLAWDEDRPYNDKQYTMSSKLMMSKFGWKPLVSLEKGLAETYNWYVEHPNWFDT